MVKLYLILYFIFFSQIANSSGECFVALEGVLKKSNSTLGAFTRKNKKILKKLTESKLLSEKDISLENLIFVRDRETNNLAYILSSKNNLFLFDSSLPEGYELIDGRAFGFSNKLPLESQYEVLKGNFVIKTLNEKTILLPKSQFGDNVVEEYLKNSNGPNTEHIKKWSDELQYLISTPQKEPNGNYSVLPLAGLDQAVFYDVALTKRPDEKLTLMNLNGKIYFLTKESYPWLSTSENSELLRPLQFTFSYETKILKFKNDKGVKIFFNTSNGGLFVDNGNSLEGLFTVLKKANPNAGADFENLFSDDVLDMVIQEELTNIKKTQLFSVSGKEKEYVLFLNDKIFYFAKNGADFLQSDNSWTEITKRGIGFNRVSEKELILDQNFVLKISTNNISLLPIVEKSPAFLNQLTQHPDLPQMLKDIIQTYNAEFIELLKDYPLTQSSFIKSSFQIVTDSKTGKQVVYMQSEGGLHVFFSPELVPNDKLFGSKRFYVHQKQTQIGFGSFDDRIFKVGKDAEIRLTSDGGLFFNNRETLKGLFDAIKQGNPTAGETFEKLFRDDIVELLTKNYLSNLQQIQLFSVSGKTNEYVLLLNNQVFYFSKSGIDFLNIDSSWAEITKLGFGINSQQNIELILDQKYLLKISNQSASLLPIVEKSPTFLDELFDNPKMPQIVKEIIYDHIDEFIELLDNSSLTRSSFIKANFQFVTDSKTGKEMLYMETENGLHVFFSKELIPGDKLFSKKKFYIVDTQNEIGFESFQDRIFKIGNEIELKVTARGLEVTPVQLETFTKNNLDQILSDEVDISPFFKEMIKLNRDELENLLNSKKISLSDLLPPNSSFAMTADGTEKYWAVPIKDDLLLFDLNNNQAPVSFLERGEQFPDYTLLLEDGSSRIRKRSIGFAINGEKFSVVEASQTVAEIQKVFVAKIVRTLDRELDDEEIQVIVKAFAHGLKEVGADGRSAAQIGNFTELQIIEKIQILKESKLFTDVEIQKLFYYRHL